MIAAISPTELLCCVMSGKSIHAQGNRSPALGTELGLSRLADAVLQNGGKLLLSKIPAILRV
jgi:hypothetical protein